MRASASSARHDAPLPPPLCLLPPRVTASASVLHPHPHTPIDALFPHPRYTPIDVVFHAPLHGPPPLSGRHRPRPLRTLAGRVNLIRAFGQSYVPPRRPVPEIAFLERWHARSVHPRPSNLIVPVALPSVPSYLILYCKAVRGRLCRPLPTW
ncbi:hypothetical protein DFH08DRAFT_972232 [Mycena albidolilacea]|uniref:Uncharacterized protein n=1 Tax=Mycena albidolilacea TaxID=1033008 RepID=A0AAD6ZBK1_9AGAR|nr:hypothetical protein DFH08DRAFT_972232 [Mycena albidolilacea]